MMDEDRIAMLRAKYGLATVSQVKAPVAAVQKEEHVPEVVQPKQLPAMALFKSRLKEPEPPQPEIPKRDPLALVRRGRGGSRKRVELEIEPEDEKSVDEGQSPETPSFPSDLKKRLYVAHDNVVNGGQPGEVSPIIQARVDSLRRMSLTVIRAQTDIYMVGLLNAVSMAFASQALEDFMLGKGPLEAVEKELVTRIENGV